TPPSETVPSLLSPHSPISTRTSVAAPAATIGTWNTAPADERTALGFQRSTVPSQHTTASAPAAHADRATVPALPGSRTSTQTTTSCGLLALSSVSSN